MAINLSIEEMNNDPAWQWDRYCEEGELRADELAFIDELANLE